jgi:hypothetical protein
MYVRRPTLVGMYQYRFSITRVYGQTCLVYRYLYRSEILFCTLRMTLVLLGEGEESLSVPQWPNVPEISLPPVTFTAYFYIPPF